MTTCLVYFAGLKTRDVQVLTEYLAYNERNPSVNIILKLEISKAFNVCLYSISFWHWTIIKGIKYSTEILYLS